MRGKKHTHIGGQAVIEGVMMRGKRHWTVTVRKSDGSLVTKTEGIPPATERFPFFTWPILRGVLALWEALTIAMAALSYSATQAGEEEVQISKREVGFSMTLGILLAVGLFILLPAFATNVLTPWVGKGVWWNLVDGIFRIVVFVGYLWAVGRIPDIKRVFEYHGAEHKTIHAYEGRVPLEPDRIQAFSTMHVRCGTSFLLVVMVLAIVVFSLLGHQTLFWRIASRVLLLPLVAGLSYEVIKFAGTYEHLPVVRAVMWPGLALQAMTTRAPSLDQIEVAVRSLREVLDLEGDEMAVHEEAAAADA